MNIQLLTAIAEQNRMNIIELLMEGPLAVGVIAKKLGMSQPQVSKHLKILNDAGFVAVENIGQRHLYSLNSEPFITLIDWSSSCRRNIGSKKDISLDYMGELKIQH